MKNKKNRFAFVIVALILFLGVGYAVVTSTDLSITGTASVADSNIDVEFDSTFTPTVANKEGNKGTVVATGTNGTANTNGKYLSATIEVSGLKAIGDSTTVTYQVINHEEFDAELSVESAEAEKGDFYTVTTAFPNGAVVTGEDGTKTVTVTVELTHLPVEEDDSETNVTVELLAVPYEN